MRCYYKYAQIKHYLQVKTVQNMLVDFDVTFYWRNQLYGFWTCFEVKNILIMDSFFFKRNFLLHKTVWILILTAPIIGEQVM